MPPLEIRQASLLSLYLNRDITNVSMYLHNVIYLLWNVEAYTPYSMNYVLQFA